MAVKTENDLSPGARSMWLKAHSAVEMRNYGYAISLLQDVLKEEPEFLKGRQVLRRSAVANSKGSKSLFGGGFGSKAAGMVKKDPKGALVEAEKTLAEKPYDVAANMALKDAAMALEYTEIAQFALETVVEGNAKDTKLMHQFAEFLETHGNAERAAEVYTRIQQIDPSDLNAVKRAKDASAKASMSRGGWEKEGDFRKALKDEAESQKLEEDRKDNLSAEQIERLMREYYANYEADPTNLNWVRRLANLCEKREDWETALQWWTYAHELGNNADPGIKRKMDELGIKLLEQRIDEYKNALADQTLDEDTRAQYQATYDELTGQRAERRLEAARARVAANPTDLSLRLELGDLLFQTANYDEAIGHLQKAINSPSGKIRARLLLGKCYESKGMYDFAIRQLEQARDSLPTMDSTKKDVVYSLGLVLEKLGKQAEYIDSMKQIYEVDYGFRDVAKRVEAAY
jgi:tetratricopeptide (TPR) repeat protein